MLTEGRKYRRSPKRFLVQVYAVHDSLLDGIATVENVSLRGTRVLTWRAWESGSHLELKSPETKSDSHVYVLVNLGQKNARQRLSPPDFYVVPSRILARRMCKTPPRGRTRSIFYFISRARVEEFKNKWGAFGKAVTVGNEEQL